MQKTTRNIRVTRDLVLFIVGVVGIFWQTAFEEIDRPYLLAVFVACVGLPTYLVSGIKFIDKSEKKEEGNEP